jgi:hypothetical protein
MDKQFEQMEKEFNLLKQEFNSNKITDQEFKDRLKRLRLKDDKGKYWTIGVQSGKWYYFDGKSWIESQPPAVQKGKAICIYCGYENDLKNESCLKCGGRIGEEKEDITCPDCGTRLMDESQPCPFCDSKKKLKERMEEEVEDPYEQEKGQLYNFRSIHIFSFLLFWGALGLIPGLVLGAFMGVANYYSEIIQYFPDFLKSLHGKLLGGIVFGVMGGATGFALLAVFGIVLAVVINVILSFVGGVKVRLTKSS